MAFTKEIKILPGTWDVAYTLIREISKEIKTKSYVEFGLFDQNTLKITTKSYYYFSQIRSKLIKNNCIPTRSTLSQRNIERING